MAPTPVVNLTQWIIETASLFYKYFYQVLGFEKNTFAKYCAQNHHLATLLLDTAVDELQVVGRNEVFVVHFNAVVIDQGVQVFIAERLAENIILFK